MMHNERRHSGRGRFPGRDHSLRGERRGRGRAQRGDVRAATLILLAEQPMHGYQLMQAMTERTRGAWRPSPGAIYPTIAQLEDEGLVTVEVEGGRKLVSLTDAGRAYLDDPRHGVTDPFAAITASYAEAPSLRAAITEVHSAARAVAANGTRAQVDAAQSVLADARRALYLILADGAGSSTEDTGDPS
ncbi:MAG TPA: PadR family transcriptional regulator [Pseudonocardiaceae bacterium]|jgi:DNA-binding PadR family transcriptional regulator|nr:PadR family transcriptional regulator [Pseudonocardiaceae bacterium]